MGELDDRLDKLSPEKRALLERLLAERRATTKRSDGPIPARAADERGHVLSFSQERFWFLEQLEPGNLAHHIAGKTVLRGTLDLEVFTQALEEVIRRHEILRTVFDERDGHLVQIVRPAAPIDLLPRDLRGLSDAEQAQERRRLEARVFRSPFDLRRGPLIRFLLVRLGDEDWELLSCLHHIIADGLSARVVAAEHGAVYSARLRGESPKLQELPIQYRDYAAWQRETLTEAVLEEKLDYWRGTLQDVAPLELPADRPRRADRRSVGSRARREISKETFAAGLKLARSERTTPFVLILTTFQAALSRWTGQYDLTVGTPVANRDRAEVEGLIGFFVNSLVLRLDASGDPSFRELLQRARDRVLESQEHQDVPFERIVDALQPERVLDRNPLFQVVFNWVDYVGEDFALPGLELRYEGRPAGTLFEATLYATRVEDRLELAFEYDSDLFEPEKMERFLEELETLLASATEDPDRRLSELSLLTGDESRRIAEWESGPVTGSMRSVLERFQVQVDRRPDAIAVQDEDRSWSYDELDRAASRIAALLSESGLGPGHRVGLLLERTGALVAAVLGIARSGVAYVPLDPDFPRARRDGALEDAQVSAIVTEASLQAECPHGVPLVLWDAIPSGDFTAPEVDPESPMYVIYTSGSTGRPKGVSVPHRAVARFVEAMLEAPGFQGGDVLVAVTTIAFDIAVLELLVPLAAGGRVVLATRETAMDGIALAELLERSDATVLQATPATWRLLRLAGWRGRPGLRLLCGGEPLPRDLAEELLPLGAELWNLYGPTETTIWSTIERVRSAPGQPIPIGRPIRGTRVRVAAEDGQPVPIGVDGELWIAGEGVAIGYWNEPELTSDRFVSASGVRWYRTGDRARWRSDGKLVCLGRLDTQIKLRGYRIEPGEIEARLRDHPAVADAAVTLWEPTDDDRRLVAYVTTERTSAQSDDEVESWRQVWDTVYSGSEAKDPLFDITGWGDSTTGQPMSQASMRQWVDGTVARLLDLRPRRVLEIGCGLGLLTFRVAASCERYLAIDATASAVAHVSRICLEHGFDAVETRQLAADDLESLPEESFDLIVLNSVAQYFPSAKYLLEVMRQAIRRLAPGGHLFLGDLRNAPLLELFHANVQVARADESDDAETIRARAERGVQRERELTIDPALFEGQLLLGGDVRIDLRSGAIHDELTRYRYDVTLSAREPGPAPTDTRSWSSLEALSKVADWLEASDSDAVRLTSIPNARLSRVLEAKAALQGRHQTAAGLKAILAAEPIGVEPDALRQIAEKAGLRVELRWSGRAGEMDAIFRREVPVRPVALMPPGDIDVSSWIREPEATSHALPDVLRSHLQESLPEAWIPSAIVRLEAMPRTPNGKLDRRALPAPDVTRRRGELVPLEGEAEQVLGEIFAEVLQTSPIGRDDDFFDLGGHSLLATSIVSRIRQRLNVELPLRQIFKTPVVGALAAAVAAARADAAPIESIPPLPRGDALPVSFIQERMWFLHQLDPALQAYHMPGAIVLDGELDEAILRDALQDVVQRHESLRTVFRARDDGRLEARLTSGGFEWSSEDLNRSLEPLAAFRERAQTLAARPFDLTHGPLLRVALFELGPRWHGLAVVLHHIIADGWSIAVLTRELAAAVEARTSGRALTLAPLRVQVADWAAWMKQRAQAGGLERSLSYWRRQLEGAPMFLPLPTDAPRPPVVTDSGDRLVARLDREIRERLKAYAAAHDATPYMTLLAVFSVWMQRITGEDELLIATPVAGRDHPDVETLIGCFIEQVVLRIRPGSAGTFDALVGEVRTTVTEALEHADLPFERLVEAIDPPRDRSRPPLAQVSFESLDFPMIPAQIGAARVTAVPVGTVAPKFELTVRIGGIDTGEVTIEYRSDLFEPRTIERWWQCFDHLLTRVLEQPAQKLSAISAVPPAQRDALLEAAQGPIDEAVGSVSLARTLFEVCSRRPDAVAIRSADASWTFQELIERASTVAAALHRLGLGAEDRIAVSLPRSPELLAVVVGALRAGVPWVPLDPSDPPARRKSILEDCDARLVITNDASALPNGLAARTFEALSREAGPMPPWPDDLEAPAYVLYTSGSTGRPKGVVVTRRGLSNYVDWAARHYPIASGDGAPLFTSLSFDLTITSLFPVWLGGRPVHLLPEGPGIEPLLGAMDVFRPFSLVKLTPAHLTALALATTPEQRRGWSRALVVGGEALEEHHLEPWLRADPEVRIFNEYGPTETVVGCCVYEVTPGESGSVPIGRPIANTTLDVVDAGGELSPWGAAGELWIGGAGVAQGYLGREKLTRERFVPDAFGRAGQVYRSGDRVRRRADGSLMYLGRDDDQIKIRGHRIELGEIEAALHRLPGVREAAVATRSGPSGLRLIAALLGDEPTPGAWREALAKELPSAWIPSVLTALAALPVTAHGKVDRAALPDSGSPREHSPQEAPVDTIEEQLLAHWTEILEADGLGTHDDFFAVGGDSILALQIVARAQRDGLPVQTVDLFEHPTITALAAAVRERGSHVIERRKRPAGPRDLGAIQRWFFERFLVRETSYDVANIPSLSHWNQSLAFTLPLGVDTDRLQVAVEAIIESHDALRSRFRGGKSPSAEAIDDAAVPIERIDLSGPDEEAARQAFLERSRAAQAELDIEQGPIIRLVHGDRGPEVPSWLAWIVHHLVVDGVSWRVLIDELDACLGSDTAVLSPESTTQGEWSAARIRRARESSAVGHEPAPTRRLPVQGAPPLEGETVWLEARLPAETLQRLQQSAALWRAGVDELLLAAVACSLDEIEPGPWRLDGEGHGRDGEDALDVSRTAGWFTRFLPIAVPELPAGLEERVAIVKTAARDAQLNGARDELAVLRGETPTPPGEILVNYLGVAQIRTRSGLTVWPDPVPGARDPGLPRTHEIELLGLRLREELVLRLSLVPRRLPEDLGPRLLSAITRHLETLADGPSAPHRAAIPADFPVAAIDSRSLQTILAGGDAQDLYPLTPSQQGMFFHSRFSPDAEAYVEQLHLKLRHLDIEAWRRALEELVRRHEPLRSEIVWDVKGRPLWRVRSQVELPLEVLEEIAPDEEASRLEELRLSERTRGFQWDRAPLARWKLVPLSGDRQAVLLTYHHAILDGWSMAILLRELSELYAAARAGRTALQAPAPAFGDFSAWLASRDEAEARAFWREELSGFESPTPVLGHVLDRPRGATRFLETELVLDASRTDRLSERTRRAGWTLNTSVLGAWGLLLHRYGAPGDVVFGATVSGRPAELGEVDRRVGLYINTVPIRVRIPEGRSCREWLRSLQKRQGERTRFEWTPLSISQSCADLPAGPPLFDSLVVFENYPLDRAALSAGSALGFPEVVEAGSFERTSYGLTLVVVPGERLILRLLHASELLDPEAAERMLEHFASLLEGTVTALDRSPRELPFLTDDERERLRRASQGRADLAPGHEQPPVEHFLARAKETPGAPAWISSEGTRTFDELARRAAAYARAICQARKDKSLGVALALPRGFESLAALLGTHLAGTFYVPLDPDLPQARRQTILRDAGCRLVAGDAAFHPGDDLEQIRPVDVDGAITSAAGPEDLAYVLYTSGSTGEPKGVEVEQRSLAHYIAEARRCFEITPADRVLQFASLSFDTSAEEIFTALSSGAALVERDAAALASVRSFTRLLEDGAVTVIDLPASFWHELVRGMDDDAVRRLRELKLVILGGEAVDPIALAEWQRRIGSGVRLLNTYGPTEATIVATVSDLTEANCSGPVPIGRPLPGIEVHILGLNGQVLPPGAAGELWIGGRGIARGYRGRPDLTAERFRDDLRDLKGKRLYRTGDRVRLASNGELVYLGRVDDQVKVRGQRVELGEVEAALRALPGVAEAVVVLRQATRDLFAFWSGEAEDAEELKRRLGELLPSAMVPRQLERRERWPRTPGGKIDRGQLTREAAAWTGESKPVAEDPLEAVVAEAMSEALEQDVGRDDDFFEMGGDSLRAMRLVQGIESRLGFELPLPWLFERSRVADLAAAIRTRGDELTAAIDWSLEGVLDPDVRPSSLAATSDEVLLTGATGFLG
ncbi:MAG: amino acid adenylation domain-containing protein, partial [Planctomycetota bacterium]